LFTSLFGSDDQDADAAVTAGGSDESAVSLSSDPVLLPRSGETIHVFSLASGHLYERFLKIMMLSVLSATRNPVKFWFLANFASPQFRAFVPRMARALRFEAEFVTYKWPLWLRRQEEKQRIIWGYKILFLDTLFPLSVRRVIYIDADQVVRGDIKELWELQLTGGAPYAYTPFCLPPGNNADTEGFRFWASGYWKDHLRGKPYHISALYVVDLDRFRAMRAGDSLRGIYDQLSADPGSLANLDQDLVSTNALAEETREGARGECLGRIQRLIYLVAMISVVLFLLSAQLCAAHGAHSLAAAGVAVSLHSSCSRGVTHAWVLPQLADCSILCACCVCPCFPSLQLVSDLVFHVHSVRG